MRGPNGFVGAAECISQFRGEGMSKSLALAGIVGVCLGAVSPLIYKSLTSKPAEMTVAAATAPTATVQVAEGSATRQAPPASVQVAASETAPVAREHEQQQQSYNDAVREVEAENAKLQGNREAYYQHSAEVRKESDALFRQEQQQGNIRAQENLAAAKLQERKDEAAEAEYNTESGGYWNNWSNNDWYHVNRWSNGYLWRP
jgi:hypothetical protein